MDREESPPVEAAEATTESTEAPGTALPDLSREEVPGGPLMVAAYIVMWVILLAYVYWLARKQLGLTKEVAELEAKLDDRIGDLEAAASRSQP